MLQIEELAARPQVAPLAPTHLCAAGRRVLDERKQPSEIASVLLRLWTDGSHARLDNDRADEGRDRNIERVVTGIDADEPSAIERLATTERFEGCVGRDCSQICVPAQVVGSEHVDDVRSE